MRTPSRPLALVVGGLTAAALVAPASAAHGAWRPTSKTPTAVGTGGAVATVDPEATEVALRVLRKGGNATDAAVAAAATLGVTEPFSAGIGGGGFFVQYDAATGQVETIDGRETAPEAMQEDAFLQEDGSPIPFFDAVESGLSVGVPGTLATWEDALDRWGTFTLGQALRPARGVAKRGFVVDETFRGQVEANASKFAKFAPTAELYLPGGEPPAVGSVFRNRDLARTYKRITRLGTDWFYDGVLAGEIVDTVQEPPTVDGVEVRSGLMTESDLAAYTAPTREPTRVSYRGLDVFGMGPPSSGGSTVGEALNIMENVDLAAASRDDALHTYLESSALAFADRNEYVGDPDQVDVPLAELLSQPFADERFCQIDPDQALAKPVAPGSADGSYDTDCDGTDDTTSGPDQEGLSTTHLTTADRWGNVVSYTLTIEQTGGSGITVPDRGFLLNNELTDFNFAPNPAVESDPNLPAPFKRPRSSMSPTIVLADGEPLLAVGTPGGSTIITTVLQVLFNRLDRGMTLPEAIAAARATQRNTSSVLAEPAFDRGGLEAKGHTFAATGEIGAATGIELLPGGRMLAAAEPVRRGGGDAGVVRPAP
jgi:gamma-glutamyltranspeptidase/glutathione hydrolase